MDAEPQDMYLESPELVGLEAQCLVCRRTFSQENEVNEGYEAISICRECKLMVFEDSDTSASRRELRRRRRQRGRSRYRNSESIDDLFSYQFSQLINLVRQNQEILVDGDSMVAGQHHSNYSTPHSRSGRWHRVLSDNESDGFDRTDSLFGEADSNISFGGYGGNSDVSVDGLSILDRETEVFVHLDNESHIYTDTDIDPMHAGLDQWNSDDQDEEDGEWEEADVGQIQDANFSPIGSDGRAVQDGAVHEGALVRWSMSESQLVRYTNISADIDFEMPLYVGNSGDYLDARGFEEFLEQLAETDGSRRGAPPASISCVGSLPVVIISKMHEKNDNLICAICKDPLSVGCEAKQLPCMHLYHPLCILPWLSARNSCPICRYELPTDDPDYEEGKRNMSRTDFRDVQSQDRAEESLSDGSSDADSNEVHGGQLANSEGIEHGADGSSREGGRGWLFLAAAPIVSIVGIVLVFWFRNPQSNRRRHPTPQNQDRHFQRSQANTTPTGRSMRWWTFF